MPIRRVAGGRIELQNFLALETQTIDRGENAASLKGGEARRYVRRVVVRGRKKLRSKL